MENLADISEPQGTRSFEPEKEHRYKKKYEKLCGNNISPLGYLRFH